MPLRFVVNDTFRSSLCLIHPPHLIALAAIYLAFSLHPPTATAPAPSSKLSAGGKTDAITFLSSLAVDQTLVLEIVQEVISLYELWNALEVDAGAIAAAKGGGKGRANPGGADEKVVGILGRMKADRIKEISEGEKTKGGTSWRK